jgi:hypothetical protein
MYYILKARRLVSNTTIGKKYLKDTVAVVRIESIKEKENIRNTDC